MASTITAGTLTVKITENVSLNSTNYDSINTLTIPSINEVNQRITAWSCKDDIQNGNEQGIDCGGTYCSPCTTTIINKSITIPSILVYPNPAGNTLHFKGHENIDDVRIIDNLGKVMKTEMISDNTMNIESLKQGIYLIEILCGDKIITKKLIK